MITFGMKTNDFRLNIKNIISTITHLEDT